MKKSKRKSGLNRKLIAVGVAACFAVDFALANPTGPSVVSGTATFQQAGSLLQITNSPNAIINWQSFSIGASEITRFLQQSASSAVLNRVIAQNPSSILGALQSNGRVFLINPNGILFGAGAQIDVAGLVASTLNLSNADFLAGKLKFTEVPGAGSVINQGTINAAQGGQVYLVGPSLTNSGVITSPKGEVILAAGNSVELVNPGTPNLRVEITAPDNEARNLGQIVADSGRVGIYAGLINHSGTIRANSAQVTEDGRIVLKATRDATLEAGSVTAANGAKGGSVMVQSGDTTLVSGTIEAKGLATSLAPGGGEGGGEGAGKGGTIQVLGNLVGLIDNASINASGDTGGGTVLVGGDFQGKNANVQNAFRTYVGPNANIKADAVTNGDGGKVIVWSDDATRFHGTISARGGAQGGDGGFVEVSGKQFLSFDGAVNVSAPSGRAGTILLDPRDITIQDAGGLNNGEVTPATDESILFADGGGATDFTLNDEVLEALTGNVVLQAQRDIIVEAGLSGGGLNLVQQGPGERVVFQAGEHITIGSPITTAGAAIILEADSPHQPSGVNDIGLLTINAPVTSNGGVITLIAGGKKLPTEGGFSLNADVNAGAGGINVSLSNAGTFTFFVGAGGNTQLSSSDTGALKTTGDLVLGQALTAGPAGQSTSVATGSILLTVDKITNETADPIQLSPDSGSSFQLIAGGGGILLDRPLTTFQDTVLSTTGDVTINKTLGTSNNDLTISAANFILGPNGSINTGTGAFTCTGTGCPPGPTGQVIWDGGAGTLNWFDLLNWNTDAVPDNTKDVTIVSGFGTILVNGAGEAKSLIANSPLQISTGQSLTLTNASTFSDTFTLSGGSLAGTGDVSVGGSSGSLTWSGGSMAAGGTFFLGSGRNGTINGTVNLNRLFENHGTLTLSGATISTSAACSITNVGTMSVGGSSTLSVPITNSSPVQFTGGTNIITATGGITNGTVDFLGGTTTFQASSTYNVGTTNISGGTANFDTAASTTDLTLSSGTLGGGGNFTVNGPFNWSGGIVTGSGQLITNGVSTLSGGVNKHLDGRTWLNAGTVNLTTSRLHLRSAGSTAVFTNQVGGVVNISTSNSSLIGIDAGNVVNNQGVINKNSAGTGSIDGSGSFNNTGNVNVNTGTLRLAGSGTDTGDYQIASGTTLQVTGGTRNWNDVAMIIGASTGTFELTGGTLNVSVANAVPSTLSAFNVTGGTLTGTGALTVNGAMNWNGGTMSGAGTTIAANGVTFGGSGSRTLSAGRTLTINADSTIAAGSLGVSGATVNGSGMLINQATLNLTNATISNSVTNQGTVNVSGVNAADGAVFDMNAGTLDVAAGAALTKNGGAFNWNGGALSGSGNLTMAGGAGFNVTGSGARVLNGLTLDVNNLTLGGGSLDLQSGTLNASGTTTINSGAELQLSGGTLAVTGPLNNNGVLDLDGGVALNLGFGGTHSGTFDIDPGATLGFIGGTHTFNDGATLLGGGMANASGGTFTLNGATTGLTVSGAGTQLNFNGATVNGVGNLMISAGNSVTLANQALGGGVNVINLGTFNFNNSTVGGNVTNQGTWNVASGSSAVNGAMIDMNAGTLDIATGATLTKNGGAFNWNGGTLAGAGTLATAGGAAFNVAGSGARTLNGLTLSVNSFSLNGGSLEIQSGAFNTAGAANIGAGTSLILSGGTFTAGGGVNNAGTLSVTTGTYSPGSGGTHSGDFSVAPGATINFPGGTHVFNDGADFFGGGTVNATGGTFTLNGTTTGLTVSGAGTQLNFTGATVNGTGNLNVAGGGVIDVAAGNTVTAGGVNVLLGGTLRGNGAITANVDNMAGTVAPGTSPGILTITGNYVQEPAGVLAVEIGGTTAGTQYDQLMVTGNATLDGTLSATLVNGFVPSGSGAFMVIQTGGAVTGTFATTNLPTTPSFSTDYLVSSVNLTTGGAPSAPAAPPPAVVDSMQQTVVAAADQGTTSQATTPSDPREEEEKRETQKKPVCTGGGSSGGAAAAARPVVSGGGGGGGRCTTRGCF